jgi:hypothetical protein
MTRLIATEPSYSYKYKKFQVRVKSSKNAQFNLAVEHLSHKLFAYWRVPSVQKQQAVLSKKECRYWSFVLELLLP